MDWLVNFCDKSLLWRCQSLRANLDAALQSICTTRLVPVAQVGQAEMERQSAASKGVRWRDYFSLVGKTCGAYVVLSFTSTSLCYISLFLGCWNIYIDDRSSWAVLSMLWMRGLKIQNALTKPALKMKEKSEPSLLLSNFSSRWKIFESKLSWWIFHHSNVKKTEGSPDWWQK